MASAHIDALFDEIDKDSSGVIDFRELSSSLRVRDDIELDERLQEGGVAFSMDRKNKYALRKDAKQGALAAPLRKLRSIDELRSALLDGATRVVDLFKAFDRNSDQKVSRREFRAALPVLGFETTGDAEALVDGVFDEIDVDASGAIDYGELHQALRLRADVQLADELKPGAAGYIETVSRNAIALRPERLAAQNNGASFEQDAAQHRAIAKVQALQRRRHAQREQRALKAERDSAATQLAAARRGMQARRQVRAQVQEQEQASFAAAAAVQTALRGRAARNEFKAVMATRNRAATALAAARRGQQARRAHGGRKLDAMLDELYSDDEANVDEAARPVKPAGKIALEI